MPQCAISSCTNSQRKTQLLNSTTQTIRYHRFPSDTNTRSKWVRVCGKNNVNVDTARVCSLHFSPLSYKTLPNDTVTEATPTKKCIYKSRLKKGVIPHLFLSSRSDQQKTCINTNTNKNKNKNFDKTKNKIKNGGQHEDDNCCDIVDCCDVSKNNVNQINKDYRVCNWDDKEYPLLYALGLIPVTQINNKDTNNTASISFQANRMLVMDESDGPSNSLGFDKHSLIDNENSTKTIENTKINENNLEITEHPQQPPLSLKQQVVQVEQVEQHQNEKETKLEPIEEDDTTQINQVTTESNIIISEPKEPKQEILLETKVENETTDSMPSIIDITEKENDSKRSLDEINESFSKKPRINEDINQDKRHYSNNDNDYSKCGDSIEEIESQELKLLADIDNLDQLARKLEREWNNLIHAKKRKEEQLLRLQRKRQVALLLKADANNETDWELALDLHIKSLNQLHTTIINKESSNNRMDMTVTDSGVTILPIPSTRRTSFPTKITSSSMSDNTNSKLLRPNRQFINERSLLNNPFNKHRNILPKPTTNQSPLYLDYSSNGSPRTGPKGQPMMDVNLIVEKFRQSNPEVPRRGKRIRSVLRNDVTDGVSSTSKMLPLVSMNNKISSSSTNIPITIPNKVDVNSELGMLLSSPENLRGRDSQNDSSRSSADSLPETNSGNVSFKDVLVEFARMSQTERRANHHSEFSSGSKSLDPYSLGLKTIPSNCPEVTLHPVMNDRNSATVSTNNQQSPLSSNSLLHGILTKTKPKSSSKPFTTLSPTLARLLTDTSSQPSDVSNINDLLANNQNRIDIPSPNRYNETVTHSVDLTTSPAKSTASSSIQYSNSNMVVNLDDVENEDSLDRLVIDETNESNTSTKNKSKSDTTNDNDQTSSQIPLCQACKKNSAKFVCAGCTRQWYCSRDCQVSDWDQHCETCVG